MASGNKLTSSTHQALDTQRVLTNRVWHERSVVPAERAHDHRAKRRPDREPAALPGKGQGRSIRRPPEAGNRTRTTRIVPSWKDETVRNDETAGKVVDTVDDAFGT